MKQANKEGQVPIYFDKDLCFLEDQITQEDLIAKVTPVFLKKGLVVPEYAQALIARETEFPTGFNLEFTGVAIPHVEAKYVLKNAFWIASIKAGCPWLSAEEDKQIKVNLCFGLLLGNSHKQIEFLQWVTSCFRDHDFLLKILASKEKKDLYRMLADRMKKDKMEE